jgi:hypothetical protein
VLLAQPTKVNAVTSKAAALMDRFFILTGFRS